MPSRPKAIRDSKKNLEERYIKDDATLLNTRDYEVIEHNLNTLFDTETIREVIMDTEGIQGLPDLVESHKDKKGRPKKEMRRYKAGRLKELLEENHNERVVPMYDGFDPVNGGMTMLTPLEHRFAIVYTQTGNATKAAELASLQSGLKGTGSKNYRKAGSDLLKRHQVRQAIGMMQKKLCVAAALDSAEVISNIREIAALATVDGKFDAALKANLMLGEYLGIFGKTKEERLKNVQGSTIVEVFKTGEDLIDNKNDIEKLSTSLGIPFNQQGKTPVDIP